MMHGMIKRMLCVLICLLCVGCSSERHEKGRKILVSIPPYATLVKALVGNDVSVEVVVPAGTNPHIYEPTPEQIKHFTEAAVWFRTGDPVEEKMVEFLKAYNVEIINLSKDRASLEGCKHHHVGHRHEEHDLHLWLNPVIVAGQVEEITTVLIKNFPEIAAMLKDNSRSLVDLLKKTDAQIDAKLSPFRGQFLLVSHPALGYFCQRYNLRQLSVETEGKDPLPQEIAKLMNKLKKHPVPVVFTEPQYNNKGACLIAEKLGLPIEEIDPCAEDYFGFLNTLSQRIVEFYGHSDQ